MQLAGALGKIDELTQINRHLALDRNVNQKFGLSQQAAASSTTGTSTCSSVATATTHDVSTLESSATRGSQGRKELPRKTHQEQSAASSSSSVTTHVSRQSFRIGGSMSVQSMLTSLRGEADIACIESQQRRSSSSYYSRHAGSQSSLSTSGLSSIDDVSVTHSNNNTSQSLCDDLHDEDDDTYHDIPTPPSSTHRHHSDTQTNSLLRRLSTTLPSLLRGEYGDSLATDRTNQRQNDDTFEAFQERKKLANTISPATLSQFNASTLEFMASAPSTLARVSKEKDKHDSVSYRESTKMLSDKTHIIPLRTDEEQSECPRIVR